MAEVIPYTLKEIQQNVEKMNKNNMHEIDQLIMMCDTQRSVIRILQNELRVYKQLTNSK